MWLRKPYKGNFAITSEFGMRMHPIYKVEKLHKGIDIALFVGTEILAPLDGTVNTLLEQSAGKLKGYGKYIVLTCVTSQKTPAMFYFAHLSRFAIENKKHVKQGDVIGYSGNTGLGSGAHLHLECRIFNGQEYVPTDPRKYFDFRKDEILKDVKNFHN